MTDQNRKTLRSFYCRDYLWELFEQMTHDLGCSMDYLINESMRLYARSRDYVPNEQDQGGGFVAGQPPVNSGSFGGPGGFGQPPRPGPAPQGPGLNVGPAFGQNPMDHRTFDQIPPVGGGPPRAPMQGGAFAQRGGPPPPPPNPSGGPAMPPANSWANQSPPQPSFGGGFNGAAQPPAGAAGQAPLYLIFNNNRYVVDKEKFVIGRGSQQTDLTIRDGNISRKHCAILYRNGAYYIKDLDSTNGVEYRGNRIESKKIEEGDVFYLCDYELRFTARP